MWFEWSSKHITYIRRLISSKYITIVDGSSQFFCLSNCISFSKKRLGFSIWFWEESFFSFCYFCLLNNKTKSQWGSWIVSNRFEFILKWRTSNPIWLFSIYTIWLSFLQTRDWFSFCNSSKSCLFLSY